MNPAYFEVHKNQLVALSVGTQKRFERIREAILGQALVFEEGRRRLRWIYEIVQGMRVVAESAPRPKPLLERLFKVGDE